MPDIYTKNHSLLLRIIPTEHQHQHQLARKMEQDRLMGFQEDLIGVDVVEVLQPFILPTLPKSSSSNLLPQVILK